ncbi:MAG: spore maturation protein [Clostridia bacterium]|jgi:spore maturation protein B|nr:spore maturation protein [Clostridiaceae bacterium]
MNVINRISLYVVPVILMTTVSIGLYKNIKVFEIFLQGAKTGLDTAVRLVPTLVGLIVAIGMFRASGAMELFVYALSPITGKIGIPAEVMPLAILKPISGAGSLTLVSSVLKENGPDSFIGRLACVMMGSTETTFYVTAVYFGVTKVKNTGYVIPVALAADVVCVLLSFLICRLFFI